MLLARGKRSLMLVFRVSHSSLIWGFHLCQRLGLMVATTENRMRAAGKPLAHPAWEKLCSLGHG